jgi:phospholipid/cholesterol/gamma-HCH transport system permease protein
MDGWVYGFTSSAEFIDGAQRALSLSILHMLLSKLSYSPYYATIPSFHGYYMKGGALEVGKTSTIALWTSVCIILLIIY